jgi:hypothetical protein
MRETLDSPEVIEIIRSRGVEISDDQLRRWQREGLLPSVMRDYPGRGGGSGSTSRYPAEAVEYAIAASEELNHARSFKTAGWNMWLRGFDVDERFYERLLTKSALALQRVSEWVRRAFIEGDEEDETGGVDATLRTIIESPKAPKIIKSVRKSIGSDEAIRIFENMLEVFLGEFTGLISIANETDRNRTRIKTETAIFGREGRLANVGRRRFFSGDIEHEFLALNIAFKAVDWTSIFARSSTVEISDARHRVQQLRTGVRTFKFAAEQRNDGKLRTYAKRAQLAWFPNERAIQATQFLLLLAVLRDPDFGTRIDDVLNAIAHKQIN